jgi:hypothetical protein
MGALETNTTLIYGVHIRESANDGSDFSNAATDYRVMFLGEDGLLHFRDSAGAITTPMFTNPMTTAGDLIYGGASGVATRLAIGTAGQVLKVNGGATAPEWGASAGGGLTRTTLGTTSAGASFATARGGYMKKVTMASAGVITAIVAFVKGNAANSVAMTAGIMSDNAGTPLIVVAAGPPIQKESDNTSLTNLGMSSTVRAVSIPVGAYLTAADYWLVVRIHAAADSRIQLAFTAATGSDRTQAGHAFQDESFQAGAATTNDYSIYADVIR